MPLTQSPALLAYPAGVAPGFDPTHPASIGCNPKYGDSAISMGSGGVSLLTGARYTPNSAVKSVISGVVGPAYFVDVSTNWLSLSGNKTGGIIRTGTLGAIALFTSINVGAYQTIYSNSFMLLGMNASNKLNLFYGVDHASTFSPTVNTPYFFAASTNGTNVNFVVTNLQTGQISQFTASGSGGSGIDGSTYFFTDNAGGTRTHNVQISCGMMNFNYMSMQTLSAWAADPWSFWCPQYDFLSPATDLGGPGTPWWDSGTSMDSGLGAQNRSGRRLIIPGPSGNIPPFSPPPPPPPPPGGTAIFTVSGFSVQDRFPDATVNSSYAPMQRPTDTN